MITKRVIKAAERAVPIEEKAVSFFSKKAPKLIASGLTAAVCFVFFLAVSSASFLPDKLNILLRSITGTLLIFLSISAAAFFFASVKSFTVKKYVVAACVFTVVHFLLIFVFHTGYVDLTVNSPYAELALWLVQNFAFSYISALAFSLLFGRLVLRGKARKTD